MMRRLVPGFTLLALLGGLMVGACAPATPPTPTPTTAAQTSASNEPTRPAPTSVPPTPTPKPAKVRIATPTIGLTDMAQRIAISKGYFAQENLEVEISQIAPDLSVKAVVSDSIEFTIVYGSSIRGAAQGLPIKFVMATIDKPYHILVVRSELTTGADLKGKAFAVASAGDSLTLMVQAALRHYGLDPGKDATIIALGGNPERLAGLKGNMVQGTVLEPLYAVQAEKQGMKRLVRIADVAAMGTAGMTTSNKMIKEQPDVVLRAVRGTVKALKYIKDPKNKDDVMAYMQKVLNSTLDEATAVYPDIIRAFSDDGMPPEDSVTGEIKFAQQNLGARADLKLSDVSDFTFLKKVNAGS